MKKSTLAAVLGNVVSLIALWLVNYGVELSAEDQVAIVSALLLIVNTCALVIPAVLAGLQGSPSVRNESGRALPGLLLALGLSSLLLVSLSGCVQLPETPRQAIAASYVMVETLADTAAIAYQDGHIDEQQRAAIKADLDTVMTVLGEARAIDDSGGDAQGRLRYARSILAAVQSLLPKEAAPHE